jgi:hypothetical protein
MLRKRATLLVDGLRALALDYYVTGDEERVYAAAEFLIVSVLVEPQL